MNNDIIGIIPRTNLKTGLFSSKSFSLIVTPEEIIAALITKEMLQNTAKEASEKAKEDGKGFFKRLAATAISGIN
ncbi:hypothetical protein KC571_03890, partial [candidate division WWE3 bacterium]|nr:hypothetical protein [candidate division WWE3 bacterium]